MMLNYTKQFSWTAVFIGVAVGSGLEFLLNLFNLSLGLSVFSTNKEGILALEVGGLSAVMVGVIATMFWIGYITAYLGGFFCHASNLKQPNSFGMLYGFVVWSLTLLLSIMLVSQIGDYVAAATRLFTNANHASHFMINENVNPTFVIEEMQKDMLSLQINKTQNEINKLSGGVFVIFVLFLIGALSCCGGGYCGMAAYNNPVDNKIPDNPLK